MKFYQHLFITILAIVTLAACGASDEYAKKSPAAAQGVGTVEYGDAGNEEQPLFGSVEMFLSTTQGGKHYQAVFNTNLAGRSPKGEIEIRELEFTVDSPPTEIVGGLLPGWIYEIEEPEDITCYVDSELTPCTWIGTSPELWLAKAGLQDDIHIWLRIGDADTPAVLCNGSARFRLVILGDEDACNQPCDDDEQCTAVEDGFACLPRCGGDYSLCAPDQACKTPANYGDSHPEWDNTQPIEFGVCVDPVEPD